MYTIKNDKWWSEFTSDELDILGVCISVDLPTLYEAYNDFTGGRDWSKTIDEKIITIQKHGNTTWVQTYYLYLVDSPLRQFCHFYYIELNATDINCENINHIISTSCLPVKYLHRLIEGNKRKKLK